jgi:hypothetical protein
MNAAQRLWSIGVGDRPPESAAGPHDARDWQERDEGQNSNEIFAQTLATMVARPLNRRELAVAAPAVHLSFGSAVGALYGVYTHGQGERGRTGIGLGTALWLIADVIAMPVLGLSRSTLRRPVGKHLQSLVAHFVYGMVTEQARRSLIKADRADHGADVRGGTRAARS